MQNISLTLTFGEFIKSRREQLRLTQDDVPGVSRSYLATIESGAQVPRRKETVESIYHALSIDQMHKSFNWFWAYSLFNENPDWTFGAYEPIRDPMILHIVETLENASPETKQLCLNVIETIIKQPPFVVNHVSK